MVIFVQSNEQCTFINIFNIDKCNICNNKLFNTDFKYMCSNKHIFHFNCITNYVCTKINHKEELIECCRKNKSYSYTICPCVNCNINVNLKDLKIFKLPIYINKYLKYKNKYINLRKVLNIINNN